MSKQSYDAARDDSARLCREREGMALDHAVKLMKEARESKPGSRPSIDAVYFITRLWTLLIDQLAGQENNLPPQLRASLISIGLWSLGEVDAIRQGRSSNWSGLIDVSETLREGLQ